MADDLLVNGTSLSALGRVVQDFGPALGGAPIMRGDADVVPRRIGSVERDSVTGSLIVPVRMLLHGKTAAGAYTRPQYHETARALRALVVNRGRKFTFRRTLDTPSGTLTHEATARYLRGFESIEQVAAHAGRVAFDAEIFGGFWYDTAYTSVLANGTHVIPGDADTRKIILTPSTVGTVNNTTLGVSVTVADNCTLDVEAFTATPTARIATLSYSGDDYWFVLAPGTNVVTAPGTTGMQYKAAWL